VSKHIRLNKPTIRLSCPALKKLQIYHPGIFEATAATIIKPPLDSVTQAIEQKNIPFFQRNYFLLTTTCNNCHVVTKHPYKVITIADAPPVSDQDFKVSVK
jgi:hypothetical protein